MGEPFRLGFRPALEGLRGIAILLVLGHHLVTFLAPERAARLPGGFLGVDVFFTLSGFLITSLLLEEHRRTGTISLLAFYRRRALRLLPAVVALLGAATVYVVATGLPLRHHGTTLLAVSTYSANWFATANTPLTEGFGHMWSLAIEEQFYVVWPLLVLVALTVLARRGTSPAVLGAALAGVVVAVAVWRAVLRDGAPWSTVYFRTDARFDQLVVGALLAVALHHGWVRARRSVALPALGLATLLFLALTMDAFDTHYYVWGALLVSLASAAVVLGTLEPGPVTALVATGPLLALGRVSYSLYLWHVPVIAAVARYGGTWPVAARVGVAAAVSLALAVASRAVVETPFLRWKDAIEARRTATAPVLAIGAARA